MEMHDLIVIGGGPAGLAAACAAYDEGLRDILVLERERQAGGILGQCIHTGFGLKRFGVELTGPEYADREEQELKKRGIDIRFDATVLSLNGERQITVSEPSRGITHLSAKSVILAMGCRERPRGALHIPGDRGAGIYTAGCAQKLVNRYGVMPGRRVVILGSGDIGLIMARRMTLEGAEVKAVLELAPYSSGLKRNIEQCLNDFSIPLYLSHTVTAIRGKKRLEAVVVSAVDENGRPIAGSSFEIPCDTLLLSVGLIPENELTEQAGIPIHPVTKGAVVDQDRMTEVEGIFACGNVLQVHDLVDYVSEEAAIAGRAAARYVMGSHTPTLPEPIRIEAGEGIRYCLPSEMTREEAVDLYLRVSGPMQGAVITVWDGDRILRRYPRVCVAPGEMERITLKMKDISERQGNTLRVTLEKRKGEKG